MKNISITPKDTVLIDSILKKISTYGKKHIAEKLTFPQLRKLLNKEEYEIVVRVVNGNPKKLGFRGPRYGIQPVPKDLIIVSKQSYKRNNKTHVLRPQLVPKKVFKAYLSLTRELKKETGRTLLIESAYRSPANQSIVFLHYLKLNNWNIAKTASRVALPGYSEHGYPTNQALDFMTLQGVPTDKNPLAFQNTAEYKWLLKRAQEFGFYLSYPKGNKWGVMFEPWHWSFRKK
jgi:LAS superfamily LD-carboxypeptidase LdcB